jgi:hypothetical protein
MNRWLRLMVVLDFAVITSQDKYNVSHIDILMV